MTAGAELFARLTKVLGRLSNIERTDVENATRVFRSYLDGKRAEDDQSKEVKKYLAELESGKPKRQRAVLVSPEFKARLANEVQRIENINELHFFKNASKGTRLSYKDAGSLALKTHAFYAPDKFATDSAEGRKFRAENFRSVKDDEDRKEYLQFCVNVARNLVFLCHPIKSDIITDDTLRSRLLKDYGKRLKAVADDDKLDTYVARLANIQSDAEPQEIMYYADIFKLPGWNESIIALRDSVRSAKAKEHAEKRRLIEIQLSFIVQEETLDVSMYGWPELEQGADTIKLFENLKIAFARSTKLRFEYRPKRDTNLLIERSIRSMSLRQLACVKNLVWADRIGLQQKKKYDGAVWRGYAQQMFELLNADGHASAWISDSSLDDFEPLDPELASKWRADVDNLWFSFADTFQKWIETDTFSGELTRWIVEDPGESGGWATSR